MWDCVQYFKHMERVILGNCGPAIRPRTRIPVRVGKPIGATKRPRYCRKCNTVFLPALIEDIAFNRYGGLCPFCWGEL